VTSAQARVWVRVERSGGPSLDYLRVLASIFPVRAISQAEADFPADGLWAPMVCHFQTPLHDALRLNVVVSSDESVLGRLYTHNLANVAIVDEVRPRTLRELRRWRVWSMRPWGLADYYINTRYVPPVRHTVANALVGLGEGLGEGEEDVVQLLGQGVQAG
jgi:hypothetical protein